MSLGGFPEILASLWEEIKILSFPKIQQLIIEYEKIDKLLKQLSEKNPNQSIKLNEQIKENIKKLKEIKKTGKELEKELEMVTEMMFYKSQQTLRSDAIEKAIYKDLTQTYRIDNPLGLERFFYTLAGQITGLLSLKDISKNIAITVQTLERYLSYLIESYLIFTLPNYAKTEGSVQRRGRKVYFVDGAVRNAALQKDKDKIFNNPAELGNLQENMLAAHLRSLGAQTSARLYYWRWKKCEIDFIYDEPNFPLALELGSSSKHTRRSLEKFLKEQPQFYGSCYYVAPGINFMSAKTSKIGIGQLPLDLLLVAIGIQQEQSLKARLGVYKK